MLKLATSGVVGLGYDTSVVGASSEDSTSDSNSHSYHLGIITFGTIGLTFRDISDFDRYDLDQLRMYYLDDPNQRLTLNHIAASDHNWTSGAIASPTGFHTSRGKVVGEGDDILPRIGTVDDSNDRLIGLHARPVASNFQLKTDGNDILVQYQGSRTTVTPDTTASVELNRQRVNPVGARKTETIPVLTVTNMGEYSVFGADDKRLVPIGTSDPSAQFVARYVTETEPAYYEGTTTDGIVVINEGEIQ